MNLIQGKPSPHFKKIVSQLSIGVHKFDLTRCDERTFYITITVQHASYSTVCDLIFLIDRDELFGAISLNNLYDNVQQFFVNHFNYNLLYSDEIQLATLATTNQQFSESMSMYTKKYPINKLKLSL